MKKLDHQESLSYFRKARVSGFAEVKKGEKPELSSSPIPVTPYEIIVGSIVFGIVGLLAATAFYTFFPHCPAIFSHDPNPSAFDKAGDIGLDNHLHNPFLPTGNICAESLYQQALSSGVFQNGYLVFCCLFHDRGYPYS